MPSCRESDPIIKNRLATVLLLALVLLAWPVRAAGTDEPPSFVQRAWTTEDGLPQASVNCILQSMDGYLWIGTFGGLVRFDGVRFEVFDLANSEGLPTNRILSLVEDSTGALWIGTEDGRVARYHQNKFTSYGQSDGAPNSLVWDITTDSRGQIWLATDNGLAYFDGQRFRTYTTDDGLPDNRILCVEADRNDDRIWIGTAKGLCSMRPGDERVETKPLGAVMPVTSLLQDRTGRMWIGTSHGLIREDHGTLTLFYQNHDELAGPILALEEARDGAIWVSSSTGGLSRWPDGRADTAPLRPLEILRTTTLSLSPIQNVRTITEDNEGNIWIGMRGLGFRRLHPTPVQTYRENQGYVADVVPIVEHPDGGVLVGSNTPGIHHIRNGTITLFEPDPDHHINKNNVFALHWDREGSLWVGHRDQVSVWRAGEWTLFTPETDGLTPGNKRAIFEDTQGTIWIGSENGLNAIRNDTVQTFTTDDGLAHNDIRFIMQSRSGDLYFGTAGGLSRYRNARFTSFTSDDGLSRGFVRAIHEDDDGTIWIGTYGGGLTRFRNGQFVRITQANGLYDNIVSCILEDDHGRLWMNGNRGVFQVTREELNRFADGRINQVACRVFSSEQGVGEGNGGGQPAGIQASDGTLWFPGIEGVVAIHPDRAIPNEHVPAVSIEGLTVNGHRILPFKGVTLPPGPGDVEIQYTGLSLSNPEAIEFQYRMDGYDPEWIDASHRRAAYYNTLRPGSYTFRVRAANEDGRWNERETSFTFSVTPFFYQTSAFRFFGILTGCLALWGLVQWRLTATRHRVRSLEDEVNQRRHTEEVLRLSEARYRLLVEQAPEAIIVHDMDTGRLVDANENAARLFGIERDQLLGTRLDDLCPELKAGDEAEQIEINNYFATATEGGAPIFECEYRNINGRDIPCEVRLVMLPSATRRLIRGSITDITERKMAEERRRRMMNELDHRVRNNLASILSLFDISTSAAKSVDEFRESFTGRLTAMARAHDALARKHWDELDLEQLAKVAIEPYAGTDSDRVHLTGGPVLLPSSMARPLTMALHELAVNATKHGALSNSRGSVHISWTVDPNVRMELHWQEVDGPPVSPPAADSTGLGMSLVRGFVQHELGGTLDLRFDKDGLVCHASIPFPNED